MQNGRLRNVLVRFRHVSDWFNSDTWNFPPQVPGVVPGDFVHGQIPVENGGCSMGISRVHIFIDFSTQRTISEERKILRYKGGSSLY